MIRPRIVLSIVICLLFAAGLLGQFNLVPDQPQLFYEGSYKDINRIIQDSERTNQFVFARLLYNGLIPHYIKNWYTDWPKSDRQLRRRLIEELADRPDSPGEAGSELDFLRKTALTALSTADRLEEVTSSDKTSVVYPDNGLARKLKMVAQIIAADLGTRILFVSLGGFDTHSRQKGAHQALLTELSTAVRAFFADLKGRRLDDRILLATYSEFGRRVKENGSLGTDHGAASQLFVASPSVKGGLHGKHPSLTDLTRGDLKHHTDFRSVYATLLEKWLEFPSEPVLGGKFETLDFV